MGPLISIIVPVYNAEKTLDRCLESLKRQTYRNLEIIVVNDGSKDNSLQIIHKHKAEDSRIFIIDKENGGVSSARNVGLDNSNGDFIMFCDSDDWAEPEWCEELLFHYKDNCLIMCGHFIEGEQSILPHEIRSKNKCEIVERKDFYKLKLSSFNAPWNKIFDASIIRKYGLYFNEKITNGEDYLYILEYLNKITGTIIFLNNCVFHYEWPGEQSLSRRVPDNYFEQCCLLSKKVFNLAELLGLDDEMGKKQLKTDFFNEFQKLILSILNDGRMTLKEKINRMNIIMSSDEYQNCAVDATISTNKIYSYLSRQKNSLGLWLWHHIFK